MQIDRISQNNTNFLVNNVNKNNNLSFGAIPIAHGIAEDIFNSEFQLLAKKKMSEKIINCLGAIANSAIKLCKKKNINEIPETVLNGEKILRSECDDLTQIESEKIVNFFGEILKSVNKSPKKGVIDIYVEPNAVIYPKKQDFAITMERPNPDTKSKNPFEHTFMPFQEILNKPEEVLENAIKWINS